MMLGSGFSFWAHDTAARETRSVSGSFGVMDCGDLLVVIMVIRVESLEFGVWSLELRI